MEDQIIKKLEFRGIKPTAMRILVLKFLLEQPYAVSLSDLEILFDQADRITLYRTLKTFEKYHLIHRIDDGTGIIKYALCEDSCDCTPNELHTHFHCMRCNKTFCLLNSHIPQMKIPVNFKMQEVNVTIKGICERCSE
ncbi:transcriptional repressor [Bacteroidales bacterium OttesenSCG-928-M06]|nr:transcriptional repressor [Bacteroidales bacterium OttesenSCG-928-M06]